MHCSHHKCLINKCKFSSFFTFITHFIGLNAAFPNLTNTYINLKIPWKSLFISANRILFGVQVKFQQQNMENESILCGRILICSIFKSFPTQTLISLSDRMLNRTSWIEIIFNDQTLIEFIEVWNELKKKRLQFGEVLWNHSHSIR